MENMDPATLWPQCLELFGREFTQATYITWISPLRPVALSNGILELLAPDEAIRETVNHRHLYKLTQIVRTVYDPEISVVINTASKGPAGTTAEEARENRRRRESNLVSKYVFDSFVKGKCNELAFTAAVAVADAPGKTSYNPLFLYGGVGLGKTHLMHSIGNHVFANYENLRVFYTSAEELMNDFINSLKERKNQEFRDKYRNIDLLMVDDIQFLTDKEGTQEEFFHTFNALYSANKQIVISSDKPPTELKTLEERLRSRFGSGLTVDVTMPDFETRVAILEKKAEIEHSQVPTDVLRYIAKSISSNIREMEGALIKVTAYAKLSGAPVSLEMAEMALRDMVTEEKRAITVEFIQEVVGNHYNVSVEELCSKKRTKEIAFARHVAMYLARKMTDTPHGRIGEKFGGKDHTIAIYACNRITEEQENDPQLRAALATMENIIKGR